MFGSNRNSWSRSTSRYPFAIDESRSATRRRCSWIGFASWLRLRPISAITAFATLLLYAAITFKITDWRLSHRRDLNDAENRAAGLSADEQQRVDRRYAELDGGGIAPRGLEGVLEGRDGLRVRTEVAPDLTHGLLDLAHAHGGLGLVGHGRPL